MKCCEKDTFLSISSQVLHGRLEKELGDLQNILQDGKQLKEAVGKICKKYLQQERERETNFPISTEKCL
jgi:hypothetical protein